MTDHGSQSPNETRESRRCVVFGAAVELPADQRRAYLERELADDPVLLEELDSLLNYHNTMTGPENPPPGPEMDHLIGTTIGDCLIERRVGAGGMGIVYQATQSHPHRRVAVKILRPGGAIGHRMLARIEREAELLGRLCHPGIARIYGSGTFDAGQGATPYFIMEYVNNALPLTDYADKHQLDQRGRAWLVARVCDAVDHAHQRGVVHRDLKPGNILVDESGSPRIIDFGVATTCGNVTVDTTRLTRGGQLVGTLRYMSPEQVDSRNETPDERTDVYGIGAVLYELLSGQPPFDLDDLPLPEAARMIREMPPRPLSSADRTLRGDLETVCTTAMAKERNRRYASAAAMAADLRRWLHFEPIAARPPSVLYLTGRFVRRHRAPVAFASILIAALTAALVLVSGSLARESEHRLQVERERQGLQEIITTVGSSLEAVNHPMTGEAPLTSLLREMTRQADRGVMTQPIAEAAIRRMVAKSFRQAGRLDDAASQLARAESLYRSATGPDNPDRQDCLLDLADFHADLENGIYDLPKASAYAREVLTTREAHYGPNDPRTMTAVESLAVAARNLGHGKESGHLLDRLIPWLEAQPAPDWPRLIRAIMLKGFTLHRKGTLDQADVWYRQAEQLARQHMDPTDPVRIETSTLQGLSLRDRNRFDEAAAIFEHLLRDLIPRTPPESTSVLRERVHHALVLGRGGRILEGLQAVDEAIRCIEPHLPVDHPAVLMARAARLKMVAWQGDVPGALQGAEDLWQHIKDPHALPAMSIRGLGLQCSILLRESESRLRWQQRHGAAPPQERQLIEAAQQRMLEPLSEEPVAGCSRLSAVLALGIQLVDVGRTEEAAAMLQDVMTAAEAGLRPRWYVARAERALARCGEPTAGFPATLPRAAAGEDTLPWIHALEPDPAVKTASISSGPR